MYGKKSFKGIMKPNLRHLSYKEIEEQFTDEVLIKHRKLIRKAKALDLFDFMSEEKFVKDSSETQSYCQKIYSTIPCISQIIFNDQKRFENLLYKFLFSSEIYAQMTYNFFTYKYNLKHFKYFVRCCFPSLFNYFSSLEYSYCAHEFIYNFFKFEISLLENTQGSISELITDSLIVEYIIHNFKFRNIFLESFQVKILFKNDIPDFKTHAFSFLIESFENSITYLDQYQLKILKIRLNSENIMNKDQLKISLFKKLFIRLLKNWQFSPQLCTSKILDASLDDHISLIDIILNYEYKDDNEEVSENFKRVFGLINKEIYTKPKWLIESLKDKKDYLILSDYDVFLISWIIMQATDDFPIDGTELCRNYQREEDFCSKESALKLFYMPFNISEGISKSEILDAEFKNMKLQNNAIPGTKDQIRSRVPPLYFIDEQIEACKQTRISIILKFSDKNSFKDIFEKDKIDKLLEVKKTINQMIMNKKDPTNETIKDPENESAEEYSSESISFRKSNLKLLLFGQLIMYLNSKSIKVCSDNKYTYPPNFGKNVLYGLNQAIEFKNNGQPEHEQSLYYQGFRYLTFIEYSKPKYKLESISTKNFDFFYINKGVYFVRMVRNEFVEEAFLTKEFKESQDSALSYLNRKICPKIYTRK